MTSPYLKGRGNELAGGGTAPPCILGRRDPRFRSSLVPPSSLPIDYIIGEGGRRNERRPKPSRQPCEGRHGVAVRSLPLRLYI